MPTCIAYKIIQKLTITTPPPLNIVNFITGTCFTNLEY